MSKKALIIFILILLVFGGFNIYSALKERDAARKASQNPPPEREEITLRFIEGINNKELGALLKEQGIIDSVGDFSNLLKTFDTSKYQNFLPKEAAGDLQGFLYPDTYRFFRDIKDRKVTTSEEAAKIVIDKLLSTFGQRIPDNADLMAKKSGLKNFYQAVILASIIEKETGRTALTAAQKNSLEEERKIIAGIFYNRLNINMALESDATVNYITGKKDPAVLLADTKIKSPYNTYQNTGLPPTPICNPSLSSIMAALQPEESDYLYFLHDQTTGKAYYGKTYDEHLANKQKYLK